MLEKAIADGGGTSGWVALRSGWSPKSPASVGHLVPSVIFCIDLRTTGCCPGDLEHFQTLLFQSCRELEAYPQLRLCPPALCPPLPLSLLAQGTLSQSDICHCGKHLSEPAFLLNWGGFLLPFGFKDFSGQLAPLFWSGTLLGTKGRSGPNISFKATPQMISLPST